MVRIRQRMELVSNPLLKRNLALLVTTRAVPRKIMREAPGRAFLMDRIRQTFQGTPYTTKEEVNLEAHVISSPPYPIKIGKASLGRVFITAALIILILKRTLPIITLKALVMKMDQVPSPLEIRRKISAEMHGPALKEAARIARNGKLDALSIIQRM